MKIAESIDFVLGAGGGAVGASEYIIHVSLARRHVVPAFAPINLPPFQKCYLSAGGSCFFPSLLIGMRSELYFKINIFQFWPEIKTTSACSCVTFKYDTLLAL